MRKPLLLTALTLFLGLFSSQAWAQDSWTPEQQQVLDTIERLSATTAPAGDGADAYGAILADGFSRWTIGSKLVNDKMAWVEGVREWFDDGWRVSDREVRMVEVHVSGDVAFTRRVVKETYLGPDGDSSVSAAALAEVWVREDNSWLLSRVDVHPMDD